ncbi:MAG: hypothetical protein ABIV26_08025 [Candidatus Limnocylindrales bacterium]
MDMDENPFDGDPLEEAALIEALMGWDGVSCSLCGSGLGADPDDSVDDGAGAPVCGSCRRARWIEEGIGKPSR